MGIVLELFMTAFIALVFSFFIAKIVSLATGVSGVDGKPLVDADDAIMMQGLKFADKLEVQGIASEKKVDFVQGSGDNKVDVFEPEQAGVGDRGFVECVEGSGERVVVDEFKAGEGEGVESSKLEGFESEKEVEFMQETAKIVDDLGAEKKIEYIGEGIEAENETKMQSEENQVKGIGEEEKGAKLENDDEDDDWEGVEKSELDKAFGAAAKFVEQKGDLGMGNDVQMQLYGLHKIATEGPCHEPQPLAFMASSRSKW
ncbi:Detected protein of unknown function [Hibiscus syriacus]|uniref:ACB domain-containing protein n=2 Tax=Hibiscus syriacus TaxID=106335 RepID=A0A6A3CQ54_HIBSY|nr:Detected protein of unknown function [Hibiscus syriacus]